MFNKGELTAISNKESSNDADKNESLQNRNEVHRERWIKGMAKQYSITERAAVAIIDIDDDILSYLFFFADSLESATVFCNLENKPLSRAEEFDFIFCTTRERLMVNGYEMIVNPSPHALLLDRNILGEARAVLIENTSTLPEKKYQAIRRVFEDLVKKINESNIDNLHINEDHAQKIFEAAHYNRPSNHTNVLQFLRNAKMFGYDMRL